MIFCVIDEEIQESKRHDLLYKQEDRPYSLSPDDWEKFDKTKNPIHGFVYSVKCLGDIGNKNILDLGCGNGWLSVILAKRGASVDAIDISSEAIDSARIMAKMNHVEENIRFEVGSVYELDYPENSFDFIIGQAILHHVRDKSRLATSLFRVLKNGGKAVFFEAFGNSEILEKIRLAIPVPINEEDKTHWHEQIKYKDLDGFKEHFIINYKEFQLLSRLDRIFKGKSIIKILGEIDLLLLKYFPIMRRYARTIVIELEKPV